MKNKFYQFLCNRKPILKCASLCLILLASCTGKNQTDTDNPGIKTVEMEDNTGFYETGLNNISDTSYVILKENEETLFSDLLKLFTFDGNYYILDRFRGRTVVAFDKNGNPLRRYGSVGQGKGEYIFPSDIYVDETGVYVGDSPGKKVIKYTLDGDFIKEDKVPFFFRSFYKTSDGNFIFALDMSGDDKDALVLTDSLYNPIKTAVTFPADYVGGYYTRNPVRRISNDEYILYNSPTDTLFRVNNKGEILEKVILDFKEKSFPEIAKKDYIAFFDTEDQNRDSYLMLWDSPIEIEEGRYVATISKKDMFGTVYMDLNEGLAGFELKPRENMSVYDLAYLIGITENGESIKLLDADNETHKGFETLPDSVKEAISNDKRVLMLNNLKKTK